MFWTWTFHLKKLLVCCWTWTEFSNIRTGSLSQIRHFAHLWWKHAIRSMSCLFTVIGITYIHAESNGGPTACSMLAPAPEWIWNWNLQDNRCGLKKISLHICVGDRDQVLKLRLWFGINNNPGADQILLKSSPASKVRRGAISVIFGSHVALRVPYSKRDKV